MNEFNKIEGRVLLFTGGVYKQAELFEYNGQLFAKHGQGFIALKINKTTSKNKVFWKDMELKIPTEVFIGNMFLLPKIAYPRSQL